MPQLAAALSITNMMNPNLFFSPSLSKLLTGDFLVDLLNLEEESLPQNLHGIRKDRLKRKRRAAGTAPGTSAQHAKEEVRQEVQPGRSDLDREKPKPKTLWYKD